jgi:D-3-phosphoglycerate dehydrogenase
MNNKVLVSPSSFGQISREPVDILISYGFEVITNPYYRKLTVEEVIDLAKDCVGIVAGVEPLNREVMDNCNNLKCISRVGVGIDSIDMEYARQKGIVVVNTPYGPTRSVAELTLSLTLSLLRKVPQAHCNMKKGMWKKEIGNLLLHKKIGVVGLGKIGKTTAEMFRLLGNPVMGYDPQENTEWAAQKGIDLVGFEELIALADIITLHIPGNPNKTPVLSRRELSLMKKTTFIINVSRGGVVDEDALYDFLKDGNLSGAAIDVFTKEPYDGPFTKLDNVVLTPHLGSYAAEGKLQMEIDAVNNLIKTLRK